MDPRKSAILVFQFAKPVLQTITHLIQPPALEIHFWSVKCTTVQYSKISSISIPSDQTMQAIAMVRSYEKKPLENTFKHI